MSPLCPHLSPGVSPPCPHLSPACRHPLSPQQQQVANFRAPRVPALGFKITRSPDHQICSWLLFSCKRTIPANRRGLLGGAESQSCSRPTEIRIVSLFIRLCNESFPTRRRSPNLASSPCLRASAVGFAHPSVFTSNLVSSEMIPSTPISATRFICRGSFTVHVTTRFPAA